SLCVSRLGRHKTLAPLSKNRQTTLVGPHGHRLCEQFPLHRAPHTLLRKKDWKVVVTAGERNQLKRTGCWLTRSAAKWRPAEVWEPQFLQSENQAQAVAVWGRPAFR